jgi:crotonobetainyl-CoA:carnitine CoA-transferase CaiB-like acyl-CoA transferase
VGPMLRLSRTPGAVRRLAPRRGEHTRQVLEELAGALANDLDVADLLARGVVFDAIPDVPDSSLTSK